MIKKKQSKNRTKQILIFHKGAESVESQKGQSFQQIFLKQLAIYIPKYKPQSLPDKYIKINSMVNSQKKKKMREQAQPAVQG